MHDILPAKGHSMAGSATFSIRRAYERLAPLYDSWAAFTESRAGDRAFKMLSPQAGESFLEVAVGTGRLFVKILGTTGIGRTIGMDYSPAMLRRAQTRLTRMGGGRPPLLLGDARHLPIADGAFDLLLNCYMMDLLEEMAIPGVLAEFARVLRPAGRLVLMNMAPLGRWLNPAWMWAYGHAPSLVGGCRPVPQVRQLLAEGGWQITEHELVSQNGFRSELFLARRGTRVASR
jgi:ubiquinone/menaquinone biosynthesis C-methylase UbiE